VILLEKVNKKSKPGWSSKGSYKAVSPSATDHKILKAVLWCSGELFKVTSLSAPNWPFKVVLSSITIKYQRLLHHLKQPMDHQNVIYNICTATEPSKAVSYCLGEPVKVTSLSAVNHPRLQNHLQQTRQRLKQTPHNVTPRFRKPSTYLVKIFSRILVFQLHTIFCAHSFWISKSRVS
jgi:hypothetical protein